MRKLPMLLSAVFSVLNYTVAQTRTDSLDIKIKEVTVTAKAPTTGIRVKRTGAVTIDAEAMLSGMHTLGEADAVKALLTQGGFSAGSDYGSGLSINGESYDQAVYVLNGAPVFFPFHFGGMFSTFNTSHLSSVSVSPWLKSVADYDRLGSEIDFETSGEIPERTGATASVGMLASSATTNIRVDSLTALSLSARASYINAFYSDILSTDDSKVRYNFGDFNTTLLRKINQSNRIDLNFLGNLDRLTISDKGYSMATRLKWDNLVGSARWTNTSSRHLLTTTAYYTRFSNKIDIDFDNMGIKMPTHIEQWGLRGNLKILNQRMELGADMELTHFSPQDITTHGDIGDNDVSISYQSRYFRVYASWLQRLWYGVDMEIGTRASLFQNEGKSFVHLDPLLTLRYNRGAHSLSLQAMAASQYLHQVSISDVGLSSNFWIPSTSKVKPQRSYSVTAHYGGYFLDGMLGTEASVFYKRVLNEAEFTGNLLSMLSPFYRYEENVENINGFNAGGNIGVTLRIHRLLASANYALTLSRRRYWDFSDLYLPSAHEILNSLKIQAGYRFNNHWTVDANFNYRSGRPYTPIKGLYMIGGNVLSINGIRNSHRLPAYHRLDLSSTYTFTVKIGSRRLENMVNLSIINAYGRGNVEMQYYSIKDYKIYLKTVKTIVRMLPSVSYTVKF